MEDGWIFFNANTGELIDKSYLQIGGHIKGWYVCVNMIEQPTEFGYKEKESFAKRVANKSGKKINGFVLLQYICFNPKTGEAFKIPACCEDGFYTLHNFKINSDDSNNTYYSFEIWYTSNSGTDHVDYYRFYPDLKEAYLNSNEGKGDLWKDCSGAKVKKFNIYPDKPKKVPSNKESRTKLKKEDINNRVGT